MALIDDLKTMDEFASTVMHETQRRRSIMRDAMTMLRTGKSEVVVRAILEESIPNLFGGRDERAEGTWVAGVVVETPFSRC